MSRPAFHFDQVVDQVTASWWADSGRVILRCGDLSIHLDPADAFELGLRLVEAASEAAPARSDAGSGTTTQDGGAS